MPRRLTPTQKILPLGLQNGRCPLRLPQLEPEKRRAKPDLVSILDLEPIEGPLPALDGRGTRVHLEQITSMFLADGCVSSRHTLCVEHQATGAALPDHEEAIVLYHVRFPTRTQHHQAGFRTLCVTECHIRSEADDVVVHQLLG